MASDASSATELSMEEQLEQKTQEVLALREKLREVVAAAECSEERMVNKVRITQPSCYADFELFLHSF